MASSGGEPKVEAAMPGSQRWAGVTGAVGVGAMAVAFVVLAALGSMPAPARWAAVIIAVVLAILAAVLWHRHPAAIVLALVVGGLSVFVGVQVLLAGGDDVYEHVPQALDVVVPALALVLGAVVLIGGAASVDRGGRVGRSVSAIVLGAGLALVALGARWLLEVHGLPAVVAGLATTVSTCGSAFRPDGATQVQACWEVLIGARDDGRMAMAIGGGLALVGIGAVLGQFGRHAWPAAAVSGGALALTMAWFTISMPVQSTACVVANERVTGPACDGLRAAITTVSSGLAVVGAPLVVVGLVGVAMQLVGRARPGSAAQVSA